MITSTSHDTVVLLKRSLRHVVRSPDTIITTAVTPVALLVLFVYVLGGAIRTGGGRYVDYLLPGILLVTVASGVAYTAFRLFTDVSGGIVERFQSMPIARSAVLWGHVLTSVVANLVSLVTSSSSPWPWGSVPARACSPGSGSSGSWCCSPSR